MYELPPADVVGYEATCLNCQEDVVVTIADSALEHRPWRLTWVCPECYGDSATRVPPVVAEALRMRFSVLGVCVCRSARCGCSSGILMMWSAVLNRNSERRRKRDAVYPERRVAVYERSGGRCEVAATADCTGRCEQVHHIAGRTGVDPHRLANLLGACEPCHRYIHANPRVARERGWMRSRLAVERP